MTYIYYDKNNVIKMISQVPLNAPRLTEAITNDPIPENDPDANICFVNSRVVQVDTAGGARRKKLIALITNSANLSDLKQAILNLIN